MDIFTVFMVLWAIMGVSYFLFFRLNKNAALKRKLLPWMCIIPSSVFFSLFWIASQGKIGTLFYLIFGGALILITALNIKQTKFCDTCGLTIYNGNPFSKEKICPQCGAKLIGK